MQKQSTTISEKHVMEIVHDNTAFYQYNGHGDVTRLSDFNGNSEEYTYDAFGNQLSKTTNGEVGNNPFRYAGYQYDEETELYYLNARYYDPKTARFTSEDDPSYGNLNDPLSLNLYTYCANNPLMYIDPSGHVYYSEDGIGPGWRVVMADKGKPGSSGLAGSGYSTIPIQRPIDPIRPPVISSIPLYPAIPTVRPPIQPIRPVVDWPPITSKSDGEESSMDVRKASNQVLRKILPEEVDNQTWSYQTKDYISSYVNNNDSAARSELIACEALLMAIDNTNDTQLLISKVEINRIIQMLISGGASVRVLRQIRAVLKVALYGKYNDVKAANSAGEPIVFAFEGAGNYSGYTDENHPNGRYGAMMIVVKNSKITYYTGNASTLPDYKKKQQAVTDPNSKDYQKRPNYMNYTFAIATGRYSFNQIMHHGWYPALTIDEEVPGVRWNGSKYVNSTASPGAIHIHASAKTAPNIYYDDSAGCLIVAPEDYVEFGKAVGFIHSNVQDRNTYGTQYDNKNSSSNTIMGMTSSHMRKVTGMLIVDRSLDK